MNSHTICLFPGQHIISLQSISNFRMAVLVTLGHCAQGTLQGLSKHLAVLCSQARPILAVDLLQRTGMCIQLLTDAISIISTCATVIEGISLCLKPAGSSRVTNILMQGKPVRILHHLTGMSVPILCTHIGLDGQPGVMHQTCLMQQCIHAPVALMPYLASWTVQVNTLLSSNTNDMNGEWSLAGHAYLVAGNQKSLK